MHSSVPPLPELIGCVALGLAFAAVGIALTSTLMDSLAGFSRLRTRHPPVDEPLETVFRFATGRIGPVHFSSGLFIGLGREGLHLAPIAVLRSPFRRGVACIPWSALEVTRVQTNSLFGRLTGTCFLVSSVGLRLTIRGRAGQAVASRVDAAKRHAREFAALRAPESDPLLCAPDERQKY